MFTSSPYLWLSTLYTAPEDYTAISSQPVTFSSAPDQMCIPISISDDEVVEETESFAVTLVTEDPAVLIIQPFASVTIIDSTGKCTCLFWLSEVKDHSIARVHAVNSCTRQNTLPLMNGHEQTMLNLSP